MELRYSWDKPNGGKESWEDICERVVENVFSIVDFNGKEDVKARLKHYMKERKFIPGGRFLAQSGRDFHQTNNCLSGETRFITRDGVKTLRECSGQTVTLLSSGGKWIDSEIRSFGVQDLYKVSVSRGRHKKDIYSTVDHRWFISAYTGEDNRSLCKTEKTTNELVVGEKLYQVFGYGISRNHPSITGIQHGLVFGDGTRTNDPLGFSSATIKLCGEKNTALSGMFPGFKTNESGEDIIVTGLPRFFKDRPSILSDRNYLYGWLSGYFAADGCVSEDGAIILNSSKRDDLEFVRDVCYVLGIGTNSISEQTRVSNLTGNDSSMYKITFMRETLVPEFFLVSAHKERFLENPSQKRLMWRIESIEKTDRREEVYCAIVPETHEFVLEDNILTGNCFLLRAEDTREGWGDLLQKATVMLMSGGGIGIDYSDLRPSGARLKRSGGTSSGPLPLMKVVNEVGRGVMSGGKRRSAIWAGLRWSHPDVFDFIAVKNWPKEVRKLKEKDFDFPAAMDMTNVSVILDKNFFDAYHNPDHDLHKHAQDVYWQTIERMLKTGEPGFSVDYDNPKESLRNAPICADTMVLLDYGYEKVGNIIGQLITLETGAGNQVEVAFEMTNEQAPIVKVGLSNGRYIRCDYSHEFIVRSDCPDEKTDPYYTGYTRIKAIDLQLGDFLLTHKDEAIPSVMVESLSFDGVEPVYCTDVKLPEHSFVAEGVVISNCTEIVSEDDSDVCCLGSLNLPLIENLDELKDVTDLAQLFLMVGILYSDIPHQRVRDVRQKNMRTGLGIMGFHEWLIRHNLRYEPNDLLGEWLSVWKDTSDSSVIKWARVLGTNVPVKKRAIAPNGSISIAGGQTTSGIEPIFSVAYKRRYLTPDGWKMQYVVDFVAERLYEDGYDLSAVEDAHSLSFDVEKRIAFQAFVQEFVDNSISSTINLPAGSHENGNVEKFGNVLIQYLPKLRGITVYPDGARGGQPLTPIDFSTAIKHKGVVFEGHEDCATGVCGL
jgi:ribonucleotide reductase alpha subunit